MNLTIYAVALKTNEHTVFLSMRKTLLRMLSKFFVVCGMYQSICMEEGAHSKFRSFVDCSSMGFYALTRISVVGRSSY